MTESSQDQGNHRAVLIQQGDELAEFAQLLNELAVPIELQRGALPTAEDLTGCAIVVVPGSRLIEPGTPNLTFWPRTIAVIDDSSKTLVAHLNRLGVAMVIRRPLHPRTLRLLLLHEIYRGPERRNRKRTLIGHPIRVGSGLFPQRATLLDLSPTGARIDVPNAPAIGSTLRIQLGKNLTLDKPLKLKARVKRCIGPSADRGGKGSEIGVVLLDRKRNAEAIQSILDRFAMGPAVWNGKLAPAEIPRPTQSPSTPTLTPTADSTPQTADEPSPCQETHPSISERQLPPSFAERSPTPAPLPPVAPARVAPPPENEPIAEADPADEIERSAQENPIDENPESHSPSEDEAVDAGDTPDDCGDRRSDPRVPYDQRIVALGEEAARILVGRDLSQGGMRIAANEAIEIGDVLRVALHCGNESEPLVVIAKAHRVDDREGSEETILTFEGLSDRQQDRLEQIIASSNPIHANGEDPDDPDGAVVFGEMLEMVARDSCQADPEFDIDAHLDSIFDTGESVEDAR